MRRLSLIALFAIALAALALWGFGPRSATADERQVLALVLASALGDKGHCVAPLTEPDLFGGTYGFTEFGKTKRRQLLDRLDYPTKPRNVRLMVAPGQFPDLFVDIRSGPCYLRGTLQTPRIGEGVAFVNVRWRPIGPGTASSGAYALIHAPQGWRIVDHKDFRDGPVI